MFRHNRAQGREEYICEFLREIWDEESTSAVDGTGAYEGDNNDERVGATKGIRRVMNRLLNDTRWMRGKEG